MERPAGPVPVESASRRSRRDQRAIAAGADWTVHRVLQDGGRHRWAVMAKTGSLVALGISVTLLLHAIPWDWRAMFALKLLIVVPGLFLMVLLLDLVTRDDLARAQAVPISVPWMAALRDRAVAFGFAAGSRIGRVRPVGLATAEGH